MTESIGFLLLPSFAQISLALALEPLFLANWLSGRPLYRWPLYSLDGAPVTASNGRVVPVDGPADESARASGGVEHCDLLFVLASFDAKQVSVDRRLLALLRRLARHGRTLGGIETGSEALARAGLLDGHEASIHWDNAEAFQEVYPAVRVLARPFVVDRQRITCAGATAALDLVLHLVGEAHGAALAGMIARHLLHGATRDPEEPAARRGLPPPRRRLREAVALMQANLEEPLKGSEIARRLGISLRQLERSFLEGLGLPPARYYRRLRLNYAHNLLQQTDLTVTEIAIRAGFGAPEHFTRSYRAQFGRAPSHDRAQSTTAPVSLPLGGGPARFAQIRQGRKVS